MRRLIVVADNSLITGAIRSGLRDTGAFQFLGYIDARSASACKIANAGPDVVLVDEADHREEAIALIRAIREQREDITVIVLTLRMEGGWLKRALEAGADAAISKAVHPAALATLARETMSGHIVHAPASIRLGADAAPTEAAQHPSLTQRELEVLGWVASGATNGEIARRLWITQQTVKFHVANIYRKLNVANRTEACHYAHINELVASTEPLSVA